MLAMYFKFRDNSPQKQSERLVFWLESLTCCSILNAFEKKGCAVSLENLTLELMNAILKDARVKLWWEHFYSLVAAVCDKVLCLVIVMSQRLLQASKVHKGLGYSHRLYYRTSKQAKLE